MSSKTSILLLLVVGLTVVWSQNETPAPTTVAPTTVAPTTLAPTTVAPTTFAPTTVAPTTVAPTTVAPTTVAPTTVAPTAAPSTLEPTSVSTPAPSTPSSAPTDAPTEAPAFSCSSHSGTRLDLEAISGFWYDQIRASSFETYQCTRYELPSMPTDGEVKLQLSYVDTADDKWEHAAKSSSFPWDPQTAQGIFYLSAGEGTGLSGTLKVIEVQQDSYVLLCGYSALSTTKQLFKVVTRERELSSENKELIEKKLQELGPQPDSLQWIEQSEAKCNSAMRMAGGVLSALALVLLVLQRNL